MAWNSALLLYLLGACMAIALGAALRALARSHRGAAACIAEGLGWRALAAGVMAVGALAFAHVSGRLGPAQLWFRAPTFYLAAVILVIGVAWWLRRPASAFTRFGIPGIAAGVLASYLILARLDGHSAPMAMILPTLDRPAPELAFFDEQGRRRELAEFRGKVVLVNFWATWCAPCRHEMPMLSKLQAEHAGDGLVVLYLSLEEPGVLRDFLARNHFDGVQGRLATAAPFYDAGKFYPLSYLIDRQGRVSQRWSGRPRPDWLDSAVRGELG